LNRKQIESKLKSESNFQSITLAPQESIIEIINLTEYSIMTVSGVCFEVPIVNPIESDRIYVKIETGSATGPYTTIVRTMTNTSVRGERRTIGEVTRICVANLGYRTISVHICFYLSPDAIYAKIINIYLNLWDENIKREYTPDELREHLEKYNIDTSRCVIAENGLLVYKDIPHSFDRISIGYDANMSLVGNSTSLAPFFQKRQRHNRSHRDVTPCECDIQ